MTRAWIVMMIAAVSAPAASVGETTEAVKKLEAAYEQALMQKDMKTLARLMTDDFIRTPPASAATSKTEYLSQIETGRLQYLSHETLEAAYQVFDDAVLVHSVVRLRTKSNGKEGESSLRLLHVWIKQAGQWRIAAVQGSQMPAR